MFIAYTSEDGREGYVLVSSILIIEEVPHAPNRLGKSMLLLNSGVRFNVRQTTAELAKRIASA